MCALIGKKNCYLFTGGLTEGPAGRYGRTIIRITKTT